MQISSVRPPLYTRLPLAVAIAAVLDAIWYLFVHCKRHTLGHFVYPLDDSYIHLAIAKNLARHGVWGVTRHAFGAASSSPLWSALLALGFKIIGVWELLPLVLCVVLSVLVLIVVDFIARREGVPVWLNAILLLLVGLGAPLPLLSVSGMEHVLQILIDLVFFYLCATSATGDSLISGRKLLTLGILAALVCAARYEGLFLIGAAALVFMLRRRWGAAATIFAGAVAFVAMFAAYSIHHGGLWLPNSVLIKGARPNFDNAAEIVNTLGRQALHKLIDVPSMFAVLVFTLGILIFWKPVAKDNGRAVSLGRNMLIITAVTALGHAQFAQTAWWYRYEAYIIVLFLLSLAVAFSQDGFGLRLAMTVDAGPRWLAGVIALGVMVVPIADRARDALKSTPLASRNIFEQQVQFARFLHRYYDTENVELNDIGAASFYSDIHLLDFIGLDGHEVIQYRLHKQWTTDLLDRITRRKKVRLAILYDSWVTPFGGVPPSWVKVATWQIQENCVCGSDTITFYVIDPRDADPLAAHLKEYKSELPPTVITWIR